MWPAGSQSSVIHFLASDALTPARPGLIVGLVPPRPKRSIELKALADFKIEPRTHLLAAAQFPDIMITPAGDLQRPATWWPSGELAIARSCRVFLTHPFRSQRLLPGCDV